MDKIKNDSILLERMPQAFMPSERERLLTVTVTDCLLDDQLCRCGR